MPARTQRCPESCGRERASLPRGSTATSSPVAARVRTCVRVDQGEPACEISALVGDGSPVGRSPGRSRAAAPGARRCARGAGPDGARKTSALRPRRDAVDRTAARRAPARPRGRSLRARPRRTPTGRTRDAPAVRAATLGVTSSRPSVRGAKAREAAAKQCSQGGARPASAKDAEGPTESGLEQYRHGDSKCNRRGSTKPHFALASGIRAAGLRWIPLGSGGHFHPTFTHQLRLSLSHSASVFLRPAGGLRPLRLYLRSSARARTARSQIVHSRRRVGVAGHDRSRTRKRERARHGATRDGAFGRRRGEGRRDGPWPVGLVSGPWTASRSALCWRTWARPP
jgi:hypothetical protein